MTKKFKKTLKMDQKMEKTSRITMKKSCYFSLEEQKLYVDKARENGKEKAKNKDKVVAKGDGEKTDDSFEKPGEMKPTEQLAKMGVTYHELNDLKSVPKARRDKILNIIDSNQKSLKNSVGGQCVPEMYACAETPAQSELCLPQYIIDYFLCTICYKITITWGGDLNALANTPSCPKCVCLACYLEVTYGYEDFWSDTPLAPLCDALFDCFETQESANGGKHGVLPCLNCGCCMTLWKCCPSCNVNVNMLAARKSDGVVSDNVLSGNLKCWEAFSHECACLRHFVCLGLECSTYQAVCCGIDPVSFSFCRIFPLMVPKCRCVQMANEPREIKKVDIWDLSAEQLLEIRQVKLEESGIMRVRLSNYFSKIATTQREKRFLDAQGSRMSDETWKFFTRDLSPKEQEAAVLFMIAGADHAMTSEGTTADMIMNSGFKKEVADACAGKVTLDILERFFKLSGRQVGNLIFDRFLTQNRCFFDIFLIF